ncbi:hypothetical protein KKE03_00900 [Patescibacteria group bacterium]|nr:hypothetical protein [Patescibacteria group bacterium]
MPREIIFESNTPIPFRVEKGKVPPESQSPLFSHGFYYVIKSDAGFSDTFVAKAIAAAHEATMKVGGIDDLDRATPKLFDNDHNLFRAYRLTHALEHIAAFEIKMADIGARIDEIFGDLRQKEMGHTLKYTLDKEEGIEHEHYVGFAFYEGFTTSHECELRGLIKACRTLSSL